MRSRRSRLALLGVLALALSVTVGLLSGSVADAKKKKSKATKVTASSNTVVTIPPRVTGPPLKDGVVNVPLTVGKKAKGKVVALDSVVVTTTWSSTNSGDLNAINARLISPNGRRTNISAPASDGAPAYTASGPTTETANSPNSFCSNAASPPPPPCADPNQTLSRPYAGTIGNLGLLTFAGGQAKGTWILELIDTSTTATTAKLNSVSLTIPLANPPK
jgi:hypothetical protein